MEIKLKRYHLIIILFVLVATFYTLNRMEIVTHSDFANGIVVGEKQWFNSDSTIITQTAPIIEFSYKDKIHNVIGEINSNHKIDKDLRLIIRKKDIENTSVYDFTGFWLNTLLYCLVPLMIISALILTFIDEDKYLMLRFGNKKLIKNENIDIDRLKLDE